MNLDEIFMCAIEKEASDIHFTLGSPALLRINGNLENVLGLPKLNQCDLEGYVREILTEEQLEIFRDIDELDFAYEFNGTRFRGNCFKQKGSYAMVLRILNSKIPLLEKMGVPPIIEELCHLREGIILVTGPTGSGKSTTVAAMIDYINRHKKHHILTLEDPIEYLFEHKNCIVNQREVGRDTAHFNVALRAALREDPDVIFIGEMRDEESISIALKAAETGHLVISTLHTKTAPKTIDRLVDSFSDPGIQNQIRNQISTSLQAVVSQRLVPTIDGKRCASYGVMTQTTAISNMIRDGKTAGINMAMQTGAEHGMISHEKYLAGLVKSARITKDVAIEFANEPDDLKKFLVY